MATMTAVHEQVDNHAASEKQTKKKIIAWNVRAVFEKEQETDRCKKHDQREACSRFHERLLPFGRFVRHNLDLPMSTLPSIRGLA